MKKVVLVDVDETIVTNYSDWKEFYRNVTGAEIDFDSNETVNDALITHRADPLDFWRKPDLYDNKEPILEAERVINMYKDDFDFVFVSNSFAEHTQSKRRFLKKFFPGIPFISTDQKGYVKCDIAIDDRHYYLRQIRERQPDVECIQIKASYNNEHDDCHFMGWDNIDTFLFNNR